MLRNNPPQPPSYLNEDAKAKWFETWEKLNHEYYRHDRDSDLLIIYCNCYGTWRDANAKLEVQGMLVRDKRDKIIANPLVEVRDTAEERMIEVAEHLGLRPDAAKGTGVPWDEYAEGLEEEPDDAT